MPQGVGYKTGRKIKRKVIDVVSDVISAPARLRSIRTQKQSGRDAEAIKQYRKIKGKPIIPFDESNPDFRIRANAIVAKARTDKRSKRFRRKIKK